MLRLREARKKKNITLKRLGELVGLSESAISQYENGKRQPDNDTLIKFANCLDVSTDYLLGRDSSPVPESKKGIRIPVLGRVAAGIPIDAIEEIIDYEEIDETLALQGEYFALQIKGISMEPRIKENDVVIVRKQETVNSGEIAIVLVNGDCATCKKVMIYENGISLISFNPAFEPRFFTYEEIEELPVKILGKVVELRGKF